MIEFILYAATNETFESFNRVDNATLSTQGMKSDF
jgi:hypothetical protein